MAIDGSPYCLDGGLGLVGDSLRIRLSGRKTGNPRILTNVERDAVFAPPSAGLGWREGAALGFGQTGAVIEVHAPASSLILVRS